MMVNKRRPVFGIGINDVERPIRWRVNNKSVLCPIYRIWQNMLARCYDTKFQENSPWYVGCEVCNDWKYLSKFEAWVKSQDWENKQLDKDILIPNNKVYSPETCVFISAKLNTFLVDRGAARGEFPCGVDYLKRDQKFRARCSNPFTGKIDDLGRFFNPEAAHLAWKQKKHEHALVYAEQQTDPRVADALRTRYL